MWQQPDAAERSALPLSLAESAQVFSITDTVPIHPVKQALLRPFHRWKLRPLGGLNQEVSRLFCKGLGRKYFRLWRPCGLGHDNSTAVRGRKQPQTLVNPRSRKTLFAETGGGLSSAEPWSYSWLVRTRVPSLMTSWLFVCTQVLSLCPGPPSLSVCPVPLRPLTCARGLYAVVYRVQHPRQYPSLSPERCA